MGLLLPGHVALGQLRALIRHQAVLSWKTNVFPGTTPTPRSRAATSLLGMPGSSRQRRIICLRNLFPWEFQRWVSTLTISRAGNTHVYDEVLDRERASQLGDLVPKLVYVLKEKQLDYS